MKVPVLASWYKLGMMTNVMQPVYLKEDVDIKTEQDTFNKPFKSKQKQIIKYH